MKKKANLLKIEVLFDMEKDDVIIDSMCTNLFKSMIEETNLKEETLTTVLTIESVIEELILSTALRTPFPKYSVLTLSRSSFAS